MSNRKMTKQEIEAWEKMYAKDLPIIKEFLNGVLERAGKDYMLYFKDGTQIVARFVTCGDSDNGLEVDDPYYEDFYEFYFNVKKVFKEGSELHNLVQEIDKSRSEPSIKENYALTLNYHNFFTKFEPYNGDA